MRTLRARVALPSVALAMALGVAATTSPGALSAQISPDTIWMEGAGASVPVPAAAEGPAGTPYTIRSMAEWQAALIPRTGRMDMLIIPALFADSGEPPFEPHEIQAALFGDTGPTLPNFYRENSRGAFVAYGRVTPWVRTSVTLFEAAGSVNGHGLFGERMREYMREAVMLADEHVDFGQWDNDGPDGIPNSGDDNGFVDAISIEFPDPAGSCPGGPGIWPHFSGLNYETDDLRPDGTPIKVGAYFTQSTTQCDGESIQSSAVIAHEFGHLLGLPDYYRVTSFEDILPQFRRWNIGCFGVMGAGSWGCGSGPTGADFGPTNLSAWSKIILEWVSPTRVLGVRNREYVLRPVQTSGDVLHIYLDRNPEEPGDQPDFLLVEYRTRTGFDAVLPGSGVLVYHVDPYFRSRDTIPGEPVPTYHYLVEADNDWELRRIESEGGNRGEAEDMYAWRGEGMVPQTGISSTRSQSGARTPVVIHSIRVLGGVATVRVTNHPIPGFDEEAGNVTFPALEEVRLEFPVYGGIPPYQLSLDQSQASPELSVELQGDVLHISGTAQTLGSSQIKVDIVDSAGRVGSETVSLTVEDAVLPVGDLLRSLAGGEVGAAHRTYLDGSGNGNGSLDLGDVRAYMERTGRWYHR